MPSIPQSLLWISLVVLWLFVLVPMLVSKRDVVRRTSDVALATRVLNGGVRARLLKRNGPASGHRSDPDWKPEKEWVDEPVDGVYADADLEQTQDLCQSTDQDQDADDAHHPRSVAMRVAIRADAADEIEDTEPPYLDVDVVNEASRALPVGAGDRVAEPGLLAVDGDAGDDAPVDEGDGGAPATAVSAGSRRRRFDTKTAAVVSARKYAFRKRVLMAMAVILVVSATTAFEVTPTAWWICGSATVMTMFYLAYLRRQTRIEEKVRRRRMQRLVRAQLGVENTHDRDYGAVPSRLRRPGAVVLEIDDEDPVFEHLNSPMSLRNYGWPRDLLRAVGQ